MKLQERLMEKTIKQSNGCWEWQGCLNTGYGQIWNGKKVVSTHRVSYELFKGPIPINMFVCHSCDNPSCINPDHLWLGTPKDNMRDKVDKGRASGGSSPGSKNPSAKLTEQQVLEIRRLIGTKTQKEIAKIYNVNQKTISRIKTRKKWNHV